jgi:hypothetical protein
MQIMALQRVGTTRRRTAATNSGFGPGEFSSSGCDIGLNLYEDGAMRTLVIVASLAAAIAAGTAPAYADPVSGGPNPDAGFLAALSNAGISYNSGPEAVAAGKKVCEWMDEGQPRSEVIKTVSAGNPGFGMSGAAVFTTLAEHAYCPQAANKPPPPPPPTQQWQPPIFFPLPTPGAA